MTLTPCNATAQLTLAHALSASPWTTMAVHLLRHDLATAYVAGDPASPRAAVIFWTAPLSTAPQRAIGIGPDVSALWDLLKAIGPWNAVGVHEQHANQLRAVMEAHLNRSVRMEISLNHILTEPPRMFRHPLVRRLSAADLRLIQDAPTFLQQGRLFGGTDRLLQEGICAGAVDAGRLVATAHTATLTDEYAELGVATLSQYRLQGIAAAAASLVCREVHAMGRVPVWDCAEGNEASGRLAMKLGFVCIGRRIDLIPVVDA